MKSGVCPKCGAREVYMGRSQNGHDFITLRKLLGKLINKTYYICAQCGYIEQYAVKSKNLEKIKQKWTKVEPE